MSDELNVKSEDVDALLRASLRTRPPADLERRVLARVRAAEAAELRQTRWWRAPSVAGATALALFVMAAGVHWHTPQRVSTPAAPERSFVASEVPAAPLRVEPPVREHAVSPLRRSEPDRVARHAAVSDHRLASPESEAPKPAARSAVDAAESPMTLADAAPGHMLPVFQGAFTPGEAPPAFPANEAPGQSLPQLTMAAVPGRPLPSFNAAISDGDRP